MFSTVDSLMDGNKSIWGGVPAINETTGDLKVIIADIGESIRKQAAATGGAGDEKTNVRLSFEEKILEIADQLSALAAKNNDALLGAQVEWSLSALDKMGVDELEALGRTVSGLATARLAALAALADYGITQADVTALDGLKTKFQGVKSAPRTAIAGRAGETTTLPVLISNQTSPLRNRLDKQMTKFKKSHPEFYAGYRSARVIVDRGGSGGPDKPAPTPPPVSP